MSRSIAEADMTQSYDITDLLQAGIKAEGLRQQTIAGNVANVETPNYRRMGVKFEELLAEALASPAKLDLDELEFEIFQPKTTPVKANGNDVNLEKEVGEMVKNTLRHKAYVRLLSKKLAQIQAAITLRG
jgi:flagellar basal-body rod protein FlgB